jgi:hypothetical protein
MLPLLGVILVISCAGADAPLNSQLRSKCHSINLFELGAMSGHRNPDPRIADLLDLLNATESFQEIEELLKQSLSRPPETSVTPAEGENRFAAKIVSIMSKITR